MNICLQIADDIIEEHGGRLLHQRLNIQELCEKHSTYTQVLYSRENIEDFKVQKCLLLFVSGGSRRIQVFRKWIVFYDWFIQEQSAARTELWGTRPLTADMMSSAANLVRALIPDLCEKLK